MKSKRALWFILTLVLLMSLSSTALAAAFTDTVSNQYKNEISYCQTKGYVTGSSSTTFSPDTTLSRGQFAVIWCRFMNFRTNSTLTDITSPTAKNYYDIPSYILYSTGVMNGTSPTTFSPNGTVTHEQLAVITMRGEKLAASDPNAYKGYKDNDKISSWATDAVSACLNNNVFRGLYAGENFEPQKNVTRAEICKLLYNLDNPSHAVTIASLSGGQITAAPTTAHAGETITLTITPDDGKQLKANTLKYNATAITGTTFTMPATDVIVTAEFEDVTVSPSPSESPSPSPSESPSPSPSESPSPT